MSLLSVTVKKARYVGAQAAQNDSYVTLKLQNVKSTTVTVKGANPCWEQDFLFETNDVNTGLLIEVWSKGMIWDRALGYHFLPLPSVHYSSEEGPGEWVSLDAELVMMGGEVVATKNPTGHSLLVDCRFELPFDPENTEAADLQRKLEYLNSIVDQEQRAEQARRQMQYFGHSGYSEDSDYTSDLNYPVGQHANSSASQFRNTAHQMSTPQRSLETSRENSYETDEPPSQPPPVHHGQHLAPGPQHPSRRRTQRGEDLYNTYSGDGSRSYNDHEDPLSYNSRPRNYKEPSRRRKNTWDYEDSQTSWYEDGYTESYETPADPRIYPPQQYNTPAPRATPNKRNKGPNTNRRPSLERQTTLYDDPYNSYEEKYYDADSYPQTDSTSYNRGQNYNQDYYNSTNYGYQDDSRYGQEEEDRQWDSGGGGQGQDYYYSNYYRKNRYENKINRSRTKRSTSNRELTREFSESVDDDVYYSTHQSYEDENYQVKNEYSGSTARRKQFNHSRSQSMSQQINDDYDPDFPPPRSRNKPKKLPQIPVKIKPSPSLPPTPVKTQQHKPAKRTGSLEYQEPQEEANYYQETHNKQIDYNEDYNYAYQSTDNLIPTQPEVIMPSNQYKEPVKDARVIGRGVNQQVYQETNQQVYQRTSQQGYQGTNQQEYQTGNQQAYQTSNQQNYQTANQQNYQTANQQNYPTANQQDYQTPNQQDYQDQTTYNYYGEKPPTVQVQRPEEDQQTLSRRDTLKKQFQGRQRLESPRIFQQNTDSLESKDDDLRDSFETAMSSVSAQGHQSFNSEYTSVPEQNTMTDKLDRYNNVSVQEKGYSNSLLTDNKNDRYNISVQENDRYPVSMQEKDRLNDTVQENHGLTQEMINDRYNNVQEKNDRYSNSGLVDKNDRYGSNSHISDREDHDLYGSGPGVIGPAIPDRNSSRNNSLQLREQVLSQKPSPVATPTSTFPSQNHNQRYLQRQQESLDSYIDEDILNESNEYSRDSPVSVVDRYPPETNSLIEPYRATTPKPSSPSPPKRQETLDEEYDQSYEQSFDQPPDDYTIEELAPPIEQKSSFEEQEIISGDQPKRKKTSKERWHWAYNKIIHQLNEFEFNNTQSTTPPDDGNDPGNWPDVLTEVDRQVIVTRGPVYVKNIIFPANEDGRRFSPASYERKLPNGEVINRSWLIYSVIKNAIFCFCCRLFGSIKISLTSTGGYSDWGHTYQLLSQHEQSPAHMKAFQAWMELSKRLCSGKTIDAENQRIIRSESERWREVLKRLVYVIQFLGSQNLAFRGKSDKIFKRNNGNFLKLVEYISKFDVVMANHLSKIMSKETHVHYLGKNIQNELICLLSNAIRKKILSDLKEANYYSIIVDCTPDISHVEQLTLVVRFVKTVAGKSPEIKEHFLGFLPLDETTGEALTECVINQLKDLQIPVENMRGQGYDNGANMKGKHVGVQKRIMDINPRAFFVPCSAHSLNLVVNDAASSCVEAVSFFGTIQETYNFFSGSPHRWNVLKSHITSLTVKPLSQTRWESRIEAINPFRYQLGELYDALFESSQDPRLDAFGKNNALGLAKKLKSYTFICCLVLWHLILFRINLISKILQEEQVNIARAMELIVKVKTYFNDIRTSEGLEKMLVDARELADTMEVEHSFDQERQVRPRRVKKQFSYESSDNPPNDPKDAFRNNVYFYVLDQAISSLNERFEQLTKYSDMFIFVHNPTSYEEDELLKHCKDLQLSLSDGDHSDLDGMQLYQELEIFKTIIPDEERKNMKTPIDILKFISLNKFIENFPNLTIALRVMLTLPVTVASGERSFSKLKIIKNYLRSTMSQERLVGLAIMSIEFEELNNLDINVIISEFAEKKARRIHFS